MKWQLNIKSTFFSGAEFKDVTRVRPALLVPGLDDDLVLHGRGQSVEDEACGVGEGVPEVRAGLQVVDGGDDVGPLDRLLRVNSVRGVKVVDVGWLKIKIHF